MSDDIVNPEMGWTVTSEFMRKAAEDNEKRRELEAAAERVRALHVRVQGKYFPAFCEHCDSRSYPCDTIAALEGTP